MASSSRRHVLAEIVSTEKRYCDLLESIIRDYTVPLCGAARSRTSARVIVSRQDRSTIFGNLEDLLPLHLAFLTDLRKATATATATAGEGSGCVGPVFTRFFAFMKMYKPYVHGFSAAAARVRELTASNPQFKAHLERTRAASPTPHDLASLLIQPVQRLPRYKLLLERLLKHTPYSHADYYPLRTALKDIEETVDEIDDSIEELSNHALLWEVQVATGLSVFEPTRWYIRDGQLSVLDAVTGVSILHDVYLLSDCLLMAPARKATPKRSSIVSFFSGVVRRSAKQVFSKIPLVGMTITTVPSYFGSNAFKLASHDRVLILTSAASGPDNALSWAEDMVRMVMILQALPLNVSPVQAVRARRTRFACPRLPRGWRCIVTGTARGDVCFWNQNDGSMSRLHPDAYGLVEDVEEEEEEEEHEKVTGETVAAAAVLGGAGEHRFGTGAGAGAGAGAASTTAVVTEPVAARPAAEVLAEMVQVQAVHKAGGAAVVGAVDDDDDDVDDDDDDDIVDDDSSVFSEYGVVAAAASAVKTGTSVHVRSNTAPSSMPSTAAAVASRPSLATSIPDGVVDLAMSKWLGAMSGGRDTEALPIGLRRRRRTVRASPPRPLSLRPSRSADGATPLPSRLDRVRRMSPEAARKPRPLTRSATDNGVVGRQLLMSALNDPSVS